MRGFFYDKNNGLKMNDNIEKPDVDLVYLWVDGSDPQWLARKRAFTGEFDNTDGNCSARYVDNDELKYSLRSVEKYSPWIRNVFIVTDNQVPDWLNIDNPKVKIIDHKEILPPQALPCYNSGVIEYFLYKISELSEHFLYANDDMFISQPITADFFFASDGLPMIMLCRKRFGNLRIQLKKIFNLHISVHRQTILKAASLAKNKFGNKSAKYYSDTTHHNIDAYLKSDCRKVVEETFNDEIFEVVTNHLRNESDIQRMIFSYCALATNRGHLEYVGRKESCRIRVHKSNYMKFIDRYSPKLFCLNDDEHATESDRKRIRPFLEALFPEKSAFEK